MTEQPYAEVIGDPIEQSKSPAIHKFWIEKAALSADYRACPVKPDELADYIAARRGDPNWRGCNVTMPHKQAIIPLLDRTDPLAAKVGAVNTVVRAANGSLSGHNTDVAGFLEPLRQDLARDHHFRMARIIGTGGAARAIITALAGEGMVLVLAGRDVNKAHRMLDELAPDSDNHVTSIDHFAEATDFAFDDRSGCFDVVVNASALGMAGQAPLRFDLSHVPPGSVCYDIVTNPLETPFLSEARRLGFRTIDGLAMLIGQAAAAFELFFGCPAPRQYDDVLRNRLTA